MDKSIAESVIERFGGHQAVAGILGVDVSRVYRWTYPVERGGTGGTIPHKHQNSLLIVAREKGIELVPADFFPPAPPSVVRTAKSEAAA